MKKGKPTRSFLQHWRICTWYRYILLLDVPGLGEQAMASGKMMDGLATKEAAEVEGPMWEQLGMIAGMQKPGAITAGLNWYRLVCGITC